MKTFTSLSIAIFATQVLHVAASGSVCSSGIYAALAPLDNYPPAVTYCQGQANKVTVTATTTTTYTVPVAQKRGHTTSAKSNSATATATTLKTATSTANAKAAQWSSLVAQAAGVVSTFCSCAGYPATTTSTTTSTVTAVPSGAVQCSDGSYAIPYQCTIGPVDCQDTCAFNGYGEGYDGTGCINYAVGSNGDCILVFDRCPGNADFTCDNIAIVTYDWSEMRLSVVVT